MTTEQLNQILVVHANGRRALRMPFFARVHSPTVVTNMALCVAALDGPFASVPSKSSRN